MSGPLLVVALAAVDVYALLWLFAADVSGGSSSGRELAGLILLASTLLLLNAAIALYRRRLGNPAVLLVRDGVIRQGRDGNRPSGRALPLVVEDRHAVVVERLGRFQRVMGPGMGRLGPGETVYKVIVTKPRTLVGSVDSITRDGVQVTAEFALETRIGAAKPSQAAVRTHAGLPAAVTSELRDQDAADLERAVTLAAYETSNWEMAVLTAARNVLRDQLARTYLDELYDFHARDRDAYPFASLADRVQSRLDESCRAWGATVMNLRLDRIKLPPAIADLAIAAWKDRHPAPATTTGASEMAPVRRLDQSEGASLPSGMLRLVPVVGRSRASSLREALRHRLGYLSAEHVTIDGWWYSIHDAPGFAGTAHSLRNDASYFALAVAERGVPDLGVKPGDCVLFETRDFGTDGSLVAILDTGLLSLGRLIRRPGHFFYDPDSLQAPPLAIVDDGQDIEAISVQYHSTEPPVSVKLARDVRIVGQAVILLRRAQGPENGAEESQRAQPGALAAAEATDAEGDTISERATVAKEGSD